MSFDALTLAAVRDELEPLLTGARLQRLVMIDELSLAAECFAPSTGRVNVLLSADLERGRVQRLHQLPARGLERDTPFSLLVRKHLRNARIRSVNQPRLERVFEVHCEQRDASDRPYPVLLILEAMGRRSNLVLVDADGTIMDAARRTPPSRSRRPVLPHLAYQPPPPQDRVLPEDLSPADLSGDGPAEKALAQKVAGLSPLAAREIAFRARGHDLVEVVRAFIGAPWSPTVAFVGEDPVEYAPYELTHLADRARLEPFGSISEAMEIFYARVRSTPRGDPLAGERKALLAALERTQHATTRRIAALEHQLTTGRTQHDELRRRGDLLLAHQTEIRERATEALLDGEHIELDPRLTPVENAQQYFSRYRKARDAEERVPALLDEARNQSAYLGDLQTLVELAHDMDAIRALRRDVATATGARSREGKPAKKASPYERVALGDGWEALVGTSASGNASVTFDVARGDDLWLHARGVPGAHVILRGAGQAPAEVVERAAQIAAAHSAARASSAVEVDVTARRYVKKIPQAPPGLVRYSNERTLRVTPRG